MVPTENYIDNEIPRRDFLRLMGFVGAGMMAGIGNGRAQPLPEFTTPVKAGFSSLALMDDTVTLALNIPSFATPLRLAVNPDIHSPVAGNIARLVGSNSFTVSQWMPILNGIKKQGLNDAKNTSVKVMQLSPLSDGQNAPGGDVQRLAVAIGGLIGSILERFSPAASSLNDVATKDATILHGISGKMPRIGDAELQDLLKGIIPRSLTRFHTFIPDDDGIAWTQRISTWRIDMETYITAFATAYVRNKPDTSFYNTKDPFIVSANSKGEVDTQVLLKEDAICDYGRGLKKGLYVFDMLNQYWVDKITDDMMIHACS